MQRRSPGFVGEMAGEKEAIRDSQSMSRRTSGSNK